MIVVNSLHTNQNTRHTVDDQTSNRHVFENVLRVLIKNSSVTGSFDGRFALCTGVRGYFASLVLEVPFRLEHKNEICSDYYTTSHS